MSTRRVFIAALVLVFTAVLVYMTVRGPGPSKEGPGAPEAEVIKVDGVDADTKRDDEVILPPAAQDLRDRLQESTRGDLETDGGLRDDSGPPDTFQAPLATQEFPGCRTQFVRNMSNRTATPRLIVWHYTVSPDTPGWADNDALTAMSNNPANGVSWHFSIGRKDGNCAYNVPLTMKAWTQGNANSYSVGIEVIARGNEGAYVEGAGRSRLIKVTREIGRRLSIPMRKGAVSGCTPTRSGIVRHIDLGQCGGGHVDTTPMTGVDGLIRALRAAPKPTAEIKRDCEELKRFRARSPRTAHDREIITRREKRIAATKFYCRDGRPVLRKQFR